MRFFRKNNKKRKRYTVDKPDLILLAYLVLFYLILFFFAVRTLTDSKTALPVLLMIPAFIGILLFYFFLPIRLLIFLINEIILFFFFLKIKKNTPAKTVIVTGKSEYKSPSFWVSPNYDLGIIFLMKYLKLKNEDFSVYKNVDLSTLDEIMSNDTINTVYLVGHGRRHGFAIDSNTVVDYCRYNNSLYKKHYVYQIHCNQGNGKSLVEYVVDEENRGECLPPHGYFSNLTINQMFIDKIIDYKHYGKAFGFIVTIWYNFLVLVVVYFALVIWVLFFTKVVI